MYIYWCNEVINIKRYQWTMFINSCYFILVVRMFSFLFWCAIFWLPISFYSWVSLTFLYWNFSYCACRIGMMDRNRLYLVLAYKVFLYLLWLIVLLGIVLSCGICPFSEFIEHLFQAPLDFWILIEKSDVFLMGLFLYVILSFFLKFFNFLFLFFIIVP